MLIKSIACRIHGEISYGKLFIIALTYQHKKLRREKDVKMNNIVKYRPTVYQQALCNFSTEVSKIMQNKKPEI